MNLYISAMYLIAQAKCSVNPRIPEDGGGVNDVSSNRLPPRIKDTMQLNYNPKLSVGQVGRILELYFLYCREKIYSTLAMKADGEGAEEKVAMTLKKVYKCKICIHFA